MDLKNIVLTVALLFGVGACDSCDTETRWGKAISKESYNLEGSVVHTAKFEKAILAYNCLENEIPICIATVIQDHSLQDMSSVGAATILYNKSIPGQVLINTGRDNQVETYIENTSSGSQIIRARDEWEQLFKEEYDTLFKEIKKHSQI